MKLLIKSKKAKEYFAGNDGHNILRIFDTFSFHQKWKEAGLLVINMVHTSCLTSCQTTYNLGFYKIRKYQENL